MNNLKKINCICLILIGCIGILQAQNSTTILRTSPEIMDGFMDMRFGMFIHFGPVTLRGTEIGWSRNKQVAAQEYDELYKEFNPVLLDADAWVKTAKDAGMKYLTITAKHHDGFCLWPTRFSDYNIMNSPYKKDIVAALAKACKKQGIQFCIYFTVLDWHDEDYPIHDPYTSSKNVPGDIVKFVARMKNELKELIENYHPYMLWFDGSWESAWTKQNGDDVYNFIKSVDKNVIVNNRLGKGANYTEFTSESVGDYLTPEQQIGKPDMKAPWESCITICQQWAWKPNDSMKTLKECIQTLVKTAAGNGNLLLNVGPMMDGRIEARQVTRLKEMGDWLRLYGESIYDTKGGPFWPNESYASTRKANKIYLHVFENKTGSISLPFLEGIHLTKAFFLNGAPVNFQQQHNKSGYSIQLPDHLPDANSAVIVLEFDKNIETLVVNEKPAA